MHNFHSTTSTLLIKKSVNDPSMISSFQTVMVSRSTSFKVQFIPNCHSKNQKYSTLQILNLQLNSHARQPRKLLILCQQINNASNIVFNNNLSTKLLFGRLVVYTICVLGFFTTVFSIRQNE